MYFFHELIKEIKMRKKIELLKLYKDIINTNKKHIVLMLLLSISRSLLVLIPPYILMKLLDGLQNGTDIKNTLLKVVAVAGIAICNFVVDILLTHENVLVSRRIYEYYQRKCISHLFCLDGEYLSDTNIGDNMTIILRDIEQIGFFASNHFLNFVLSAISSIFILIIIYYKSWRVFLVCLLLIPLAGIIQIYYDRLIERNMKDNRKKHGVLTDIIQNVLSKTMSCILCNGENFFLNKYEKSVHDATEIKIKTQMNLAKNTGILGLISTFYTALVLFFGGIGVIKGILTVGELLAVNSYVQMLMVPIVNASGVFAEIQDTMVSLHRMKSLLDISETKGGKCVENKKINYLEIKNVSFSYIEDLILKDINMKFEIGVTAIVGESGGGKTTITSLLDKMWYPQSGNIFLNSINYNNLDYQWLRLQMSIVPQEAFLFQDTVWNNIAMGEDISIEKMNELCESVCIYDWIVQQRDQYETIVGENGVKLSGGQRQRVCLARALAQDRPILILDEAMSAMDYILEKNIWKKVQKHISDKIVIVITHRVQTISFADKIYLLKEGKVLKEGKHSDLLQNPYYISLLSKMEDMGVS